MEAGSNVDQYIRGPTQPAPLMPDIPPTISVQEDLKNVIKVDFKSKKRIK